MYKNGFVNYNLQWPTCHKTESEQPDFFRRSFRERGAPLDVLGQWNATLVLRKHLENSGKKRCIWNTLYIRIFIQLVSFIGFKEKSANILWETFLHIYLSIYLSIYVH